MRTLGRAVKGLIQREPGAAIERPLLPGEWLIEKEAEAEMAEGMNPRTKFWASLYLTRPVCRHRFLA